MATELETLKMKKRMKKATPEDLARLKVLQDGEPLSVADLAEAKRREEERTITDKAAFKAKQDALIRNATPEPLDLSVEKARLEELNQPPEHPRIVALKDALRIFTKIEAHVSRPDDFVLFTRDVSITAGDVRRARKAMTL